VPVQVNGYDKTDAPVTSQEMAVPVEVEQTGRVCVHEHWNAAAAHGNRGRGESAQGRGEDLVAWANARHRSPISMASRPFPTPTA